MTMPMPIQVLVLYDDQNRVVGVYTEKRAGFDHAGRVEHRKAVYVDEGMVALLDAEYERCPLNRSLAEYEREIRERALEKLTPQERKALGLVAPTAMQAPVVSLIPEPVSEPEPDTTWQDIHDNYLGVTDAEREQFTGFLDRIDDRLALDAKKVQFDNTAENIRLVNEVIDWLKLDPQQKAERFDGWSDNIQADDSHFWSPILDAELFTYLRERTKQ